MQERPRLMASPERWVTVESCVSLKQARMGADTIVAQSGLVREAPPDQLKVEAA